MDLKRLERFIDKRKVSFIGSVDEAGFPNIKTMLKPRQHNGLKEFYFSTNSPQCALDSIFKILMLAFISIAKG